MSESKDEADLVRDPWGRVPAGSQEVWEEDVVITGEPPEVPDDWHLHLGDPPPYEPRLVIADGRAGRRQATITVEKRDGE